VCQGRVKGHHVTQPTVIWRAHLNSRSAGAFAARRRPRRHANVVDGVRRQVVQTVRVDGRRNCDAYVLAQVRVVVVQLVRVDGYVGAAVTFARLVPSQLNRRRRYRLALQVRRLLGHYTNNAVAGSFVNNGTKKTYVIMLIIIYYYYYEKTCLHFIRNTRITIM